MAKERIPAVPGLFTWPDDEPHLLGGKCNSCGTYFFPKFVASHKPGCHRGKVEEVRLGRRGKLVSYTIQYYPPPPPFVKPDPFIPFAVGLVALPEGLEVPGIICGIAPEDVQTSMEMELVVEKLNEDEKAEYVGWKFRPA